MAVHIRTARPDEAQAVADIHIRSRRAAHPGIPPLVHPEEDVPRWVRERLMTAGEVWVAEDDGVVVGMLARRTGWVDALYVEPGRWRDGIGTALLEVAKERSEGAIELWCFAANEPARRFYERHAFLAVEETDGSGNEEGAPDVRYRWER